LRQVLVLRPLRAPSTSPPSLHDALPISTVISFGTENPSTVLLGSDDEPGEQRLHLDVAVCPFRETEIGLAEGVDQFYFERPVHIDRKSTRLNSSHVKTSYAVFCLQIRTV